MKTTIYGKLHQNLRGAVHLLCQMKWIDPKHSAMCTVMCVCACVGGGKNPGALIEIAPGTILLLHQCIKIHACPYADYCIVPIFVQTKGKSTTTKYMHLVCIRTHFFSFAD